jgi:hypothetical protein
MLYMFNRITYNRIMKTITIRNVAEDSWRKFRMICVNEGKTTGEKLTEIIDNIGVDDTDCPEFLGVKNER